MYNYNTYCHAIKTKHQEENDKLNKTSSFALITVPIVSKSNFQEYHTALKRTLKRETDNRNYNSQY